MLFQMLIFYLPIIVFIWSVYWSFIVLKLMFHRMKISTILEGITCKEDLLFLKYQDYNDVIMEVLKRKGYQVRATPHCGEEGNGLLLNDILFCEIWKHSLAHRVDVEAAMKLYKRMKWNDIHRGMIITLADFRAITRQYCRYNVIQCINGDELFAMCKEVRRYHKIPKTGLGIASKDPK